MLSKKHFRISLLLAAGVLGCGGGGPAHLEVKTRIIDFGMVPPEGRDLKIPIANRGKGTLTIYRVATSCACTVAEAPETIAPGQVGTVVIRPPKGSRGPYSSQMVVESNDPASPHEFYLTWFGRSAPGLDPPRIVVPDGTPGSTVERTISVTYPGGEPRYALEVKGIKVSDPSFSLRPVKTDHFAKQSEVLSVNEVPVSGETTFHFRGRLPDRPDVVRGQITLTVAQAGREHVLTLPVELRAVGPIAYSGSFFFSAAGADQLVGKKHLVMLRVSEPSDAPVVVDAPEFVRYSLRKGNGGPHEGRSPYLLQLKVTRPPTGGMQSSAIVVQLGDRVETRVAIPLHIVMLP
jgi:hypothetical protein